jgi:Flp pilus assembly protein TadG
MCKRPQGGVAIVEFVLVLPFLLVLTFTTTEFGRALYEYQAVVKSVRAAARYLSTQNPGTHVVEATNLVIYGYTQPPTGARPLAMNLGTTNVPPPVWQQVGAAPLINTVTVRVSGYQFRSIFTTVFGLQFGTITYSDITASMRSTL